MPNFLAQRLTAEPSIDGVTVFRLGLAGGDSVAKFSEYLQSHPKASTFRKFLQEDWTRRHLTKYHDEAPELPRDTVRDEHGDPIDDKMSNCWRFGICTCTGSGILLGQFRIEWSQVGTSTIVGKLYSMS